MKRLVFALAAGVALAVGTAAFADDATATIKQINVPGRVITLDDGNAYSITANVDLTKFKTGDKVKITYVPATGIAKTALGLYGSASNMVPAT